MEDFAGYGIKFSVLGKYSYAKSMGGKDTYGEVLKSGSFYRSSVLADKEIVSFEVTEAVPDKTFDNVDDLKKHLTDQLGIAADIATDLVDNLVKRKKVMDRQAVDGMYELQYGDRLGLVADAYGWTEATLGVHNRLNAKTNWLKGYDGTPGGGRGDMINVEKPRLWGFLWRHNPYLDDDGGDKHARAWYYQGQESRPDANSSEPNRFSDIPARTNPGKTP